MITIVITTRGRPRQVVGVIEAARLLAQHPEHIHFRIACDSDDKTAACLEAHGYGIDPNVAIDVAPRPVTVGMVTNRALAKVATPYVMILGDDGIIATPNWDAFVVGYFSTIPERALRIAALNDLANPGQATLFAMSREWLALAGLLDDRFPFWFSDTAISEVYSFVTGRHLPILNLSVASRPGKWNPRLRDMALWWRLYGATRRERMETAARIKGNLNLAEPPNLAALRAFWEERDRNGLPASEEIVRLIDNPAPPSKNYLEARRMAEVYLEEHHE